MLCEWLAALLHPCGLVDQQPCCVNFCGHIGQHILYRLMLRNGLAKCFTLARIFYRFFKGRLRNSNTERTDANTSAIQYRQRLLQTRVPPDPAGCSLEPAAR